MFSNILKISASNVLKTFFKNISVRIGCTFVVFQSHKPTGSTNQPEVQTNRKVQKHNLYSVITELAATLPGKKEMQE